MTEERSRAPRTLIVGRALVRGLGLSGCAVAAALLSVGPAPAAEPTGGVRLVVLDTTGEPLAGSVVEAPALGLAATADRRGRVRLDRIRPGAVDLSVRHLGYATATLRVEVGADGGAPLEVLLEPLGFREAITVRAGPLEQGRSRSQQQRHASTGLVEIAPSDRIGRFPDLDAASAAQRLPGLTVLRDQGEPRTVVVRGLPPAWVATRVDGVRVPSGEADERTVALDLVPTELLDAVEVAKTPSPDQGADWIGGAIDLVTRAPPRRRRLQAALGVGHDDASDGGRGLGSVLLGGRTSPDGPGFLVGASRVEVERGVDSFEQVGDGGAPETLRFQDAVVDRSRRGLTGSVDLPWGHSSSVILRGLQAEVEDRELRRRREHRLEDEALGLELKDRREIHELTTARAGAQVLLPGSTLLGLRGAWNRARENEPERLDAVFVLEEVDLGGAGPATATLDPDEILLEEVRREADFGSVDGWSGAVDLSRPLGATGLGGRLRVGAELGEEDLARDDNFFVGEAEDDLALTALLGPGWRPADPFAAGPAGRGFELGLFPDPAKLADLVASGVLDEERDPEEDLGDYTATERIAAAWAMVDLALGPGLSFSGGLRWDEATTSYRAFEIELDEDGELVGTTPVTGGGRSGELLPMVSLRWAPNDRHALRASLARTLARPDLESLAPYRLVLEEDEEIERGNPGLRPAVAWNLDLGWERLLEPVGRLSVGVFAKEIDGAIVPIRRELATGDGEVTEIRPENAGDASLLGLEVAFERTFRSLPAPFDGLGLSTSWTVVSADTTFPERPGTELPGRTRWFGHAALSWERAAFSARIAWSTRERTLEELGDEPAEDLWVGNRDHFDVSFRWQPSGRWSLFLEASNLTDTPLRRSLGPSAVLHSEERYGSWGLLGLRLDLGGGSDR